MHALWVQQNSAADFIDTVINVNYWCLLSHYHLHDMATKVLMFASNDADVMLKDVYIIWPTQLALILRCSIL